MNCKEFQDHVTDAVDNRLSDETQALFVAHAGKCPRCRNDYEVEAMTKSVVRSRTTMVRTPAAVMERISNLLNQENTRTRSPFADWVRSIQESVFFKPAVAFAVACIAIIILLNPGESPSPIQQASIISPNIIQQSFANYLAVVNGTITPQMVDDQPDHLRGFFDGKTTFPVLVPKMKSCNLVGGVLNEYAGVKLAHVVYKHDAEIVYVYQACWKEVQKGERISLPEEAIQELRRSGWFSTTRDDGYSMLLWTDGRTLCSAVARMPQAELIACVKGGEDPADNKH